MMEVCANIPILLFMTIWLFCITDAKRTKLFAQNVGLLVDTRLDPLVNPKDCSSHVHSVYGNAKFGSKIKSIMFQDDDWRNEAGKENQTTSEVIPNLSSYWAPSLYIWDGQKYHLTPSFVRTYYRVLHKDGQRNSINPYPKFFRMIVGDASRKTAWGPNEIDRDHIRWTLTTHNRVTTDHIRHGDWSYLTNEANLIGTRGQVEMHLEFPSCVAVGRKGNPKTSSSDFRSHVAYPLDRDGTCPPTHPYPVPKLSMEVRYELHKMRDNIGDSVVNDVSNWRLSTGDASGAGAHADFVNGWPEDMMTDMIANCDDGKGRLLDDGTKATCVLEAMNLDGRESKTVPYKGMIPDEEVHQVSTLPTGVCPPFVSPSHTNVFSH